VVPGGVKNASFGKSGLLTGTAPNKTIWKNPIKGANDCDSMTKKAVTQTTNCMASEGLCSLIQGAKNAAEKVKFTKLLTEFMKKDLKNSMFKGVQTVAKYLMKVCKPKPAAPAKPAPKK
jgi:hypothetical protein